MFCVFVMCVNDVMYLLSEVLNIILLICVVLVLNDCLFYMFLFFKIKW